MTATKTANRKGPKMTAADPITRLADVAMHLFADLAAAAGPEAPFAQAREQLGDRFFAAATDGLRAGLKALLTDDQVVADLDAAGQAAAAERLLGVAQAGVDAVIEAAA
jgi:hypothetical protein